MAEFPVLTMTLRQCRTNTDCVSVKRKKSSNSSFRRVKEEEITIKKKELADNAFEAKGVSSFIRLH